LAAGKEHLLAAPNGPKGVVAVNAVYAVRWPVK
jgi:hypothetical protein